MTNRHHHPDTALTTKHLLGCLVGCLLSIGGCWVLVLAIASSSTIKEQIDNATPADVIWLFRDQLQHGHFDAAWQQLSETTQAKISVSQLKTAGADPQRLDALFRAVGIAPPSSEAISMQFGDHKLGFSFGMQRQSLVIESLGLCHNSH